MSLSLLFNIANVYIMPLWILMIILPKWIVTKKIMNSYLLFLPLIALYIYYLVASFDGDSAAIIASPSLENIARLLSKEAGAGTAWMHFLAMDLFVGRWIYWQGQEKNLWVAHSLVLCLLFGPVGLLSHLITDLIMGKGQNSAETTEDTPS